MVDKIEHMANDNFGLEHKDPKDTEGGISNSSIGKAALLAGALVAGGALYENQQDVAQESQRTESSQAFEKSSIEAGFPTRESIPLKAFYAVDEYKSILGETWSVPFVPGADSDQEKMIDSIAQKHGVKKVDFAQALRYKLNDEGFE